MSVPPSLLPSPSRVVLHAPTEDGLRRARSNARNLLAAEPGAEIRIVVNAGAVRTLSETRDPATDPLIVVCANSVRAAGLDAAEIAAAGYALTPAAVVLLIRLQTDGWAYVRS